MFRFRVRVRVQVRVRVRVKGEDFAGQCFGVTRLGSGSGFRVRVRV